MRLNRFIVDFKSLKQEVILEQAQVCHQITNVLRLKVGEHILICDGQGQDLEINLTQISPKKITGQIIATLPTAAEISRPVNLFLALLKRENFELAVQKAVEIGISAIQPLITYRVVKTSFKQSRLDKIVREASEQAGRGFIPKVFPATKFNLAVLDSTSIKAHNYFFDLGADKKLIDLDFLQDQWPINLWLGPEGGWNDSERKIITDLNWPKISLGPTTLRAETAAIVATYQFVQANRSLS